jgi:hypothetical protein
MQLILGLVEVIAALITFFKTFNNSKSAFAYTMITFTLLFGLTKISIFVIS